MNTQKAAYWFALLVFGLAVHSAYRRGEFPTLHRVADCASLKFWRLTAHAERNLAVARLWEGSFDRQVRADELMARRQAEIDRMLALRQAELNRAMALRQADLDRLQGQMSRVQVVMDGAQLERLRSLDRVRIQLQNAGNRREVVICPETGARIAIDTDAELPKIDLESDDE